MKTINNIQIETAVAESLNNNTNSMNVEKRERVMDEIISSLYQTIDIHEETVTQFIRNDYEQATRDNDVFYYDFMRADNTERVNMIIERFNDYVTDYERGMLCTCHIREREDALIDELIDAIKTYNDYINDDISTDDVYENLTTNYIRQYADRLRIIIETFIQESDALQTLANTFIEKEYASNYYLAASAFATATENLSKEEREIELFDDCAHYNRDIINAHFAKYTHYKLSETMIDAINDIILEYVQEKGSWDYIKRDIIEEERSLV